MRGLRRAALGQLDPGCVIGLRQEGKGLNVARPTHWCANESQG